MRKPINLTLGQASLAPLRRACYGRMAHDADWLQTAARSAAVCSNRDAWVAFSELARTAGLLDHIGWTNIDERDEVKLTSHAAVTFAISVLRDEADALSMIRASALEDQAIDQTERAAALERSVQSTLADLQDAQAAATVATAATFSPEPPAA